MSIKNLFRCLLLIVTVRFISFPSSFIVSVEDVPFFKPVSFVTLVTAVSCRLCLLKILFRCLLLIVTVRFISFPLSFIVSVVDVQFFSLFALIMLQCSAKILLLASCTVILLHRYSVTKCVLPEICSLFMPYMQVWYLIVSIPDLCTLTYFPDRD